MKKVAILQSNYIPWKGYFDLIAAVDEFILFDDMQYTKRDWRNRNQIKTPQGMQWLTVPVNVKGKYHQKIKETEIVGNEWREEHWRAITLNYGRATHFDEIAGWLEPIYLHEKETKLSLVNRALIEGVCKFLGIRTRISWSSDYKICDGKTERLVDLCKQAGGTEYITGPSAQEYIDEQQFKEQNIKLSWFDYQGYPEYPQLWEGFNHHVTVLDLLFNSGFDAPKYMRHILK